VPTKRRAAKKRKPISAKTRASDDALRAQLEHFDLKVLDKALAKAIKTSGASD
jgi:hypothetical protein